MNNQRPMCPTVLQLFQIKKNIKLNIVRVRDSENKEEIKKLEKIKERKELNQQKRKGDFEYGLIIA